MSDAVGSEKTDKKGVLERASVLTQEEKWKDATVLLQPLRDSDELSIEGLKILAYCYSRNKDYSTAVDIHKELCSRQPSEVMHYYHVAYQYRMMGKWELAVAEYEKCLELFPRFLRIYLELGKVFEEHQHPDKALKAYREGVQAYKEIASYQQRKYAPIYSKICTGAAKLLMSSSQIDESTRNETEFYLKESISCEPEDPHTWYRLGDFFLKTGQADEALKNFDRAYSIAPQKEYISHKIAQVFLQKGKVEKAYEAYKRIPFHKRAAYILNGMGNCALKMGNIMEAAGYLFKAISKESAKFYHHRDLGLALVQLGDRDQAIKTLEKANSLYKKEHGSDYHKILAKIQEIQSMPQGDHIVLGKPDAAVSSISHGTIVKYRTDKGFGFIKDDNDSQDVFFHISRVKNRVIPVVGQTVRFLREVGDKGPQAPKVWIQNSI